MTQSSALRRKTEIFRPEAKTPDTAVRAIRAALLRHAQSIPALRLEVTEVTETRLTLAELLDGLEAPAFLAVLAGPREALGLAVMPPSLVGALIEALTTGRLGPGDPPLRRTTATDAMLASGFVENVLAGLSADLENSADRIWAAGFRYSSWLDEPRPLALMLEEGSYRQISVAMSFGGTRRATFLMAVPAAGRGRLPSLPKAPAAAPPPDSGWTEGFAASVTAATARLDAVIARLELPLAQVAALAPGAILTLPGAALDRIALTALDGRAVAEGRLGQSQSFRAIRLNPPRGSGAQDGLEGGHEGGEMGAM